MKPIDKFIHQQIKETGSICIDELISDINGRTLSNDEADQILIWANSYERFSVFLKIKDQLSDPATYWKQLRSAYQESDNLYQWKSEIKNCFQVDLPGKRYLMDEAERKIISDLSDEVTIHRGMTVEEAESNDYGISWTLNREKAEYFAFTYGRNHDTNGLEKTIISKQIIKDQILALFNSRNEREIIFIN